VAPWWAGPWKNGHRRVDGLENYSISPSREVAKLHVTKMTETSHGQIIGLRHAKVVPSYEARGT